MFSTPDQDHDTMSGGSCAGSSGWWYGYCTLSCITWQSDNGLWQESLPPVLDVVASRMFLKII